MWFNEGMFLVRVTPLTALPQNAPSVLDYFWSESLPTGSLVTAVMGRRTITAIVLESLDVRTAKLNVKKSKFSLRKLSSVLCFEPQLSQSQLALARWISSSYACSLATACVTVAPTHIGKKRSLIDHSNVPLPKKSSTSGTIWLTQPDTAQSVLSEILSTTPGQVLVLVPDRMLAEQLTARIGSSARCLHSGCKSKEVQSIYRDTLNGTARIIVGTRMALFLPWHSLSHVIVEDPLSESYKNEMTPRYNAADVARQLASMHGAELTWLTAALSTVQFHLVREGAITLKRRKPHWPSITLCTAQSENEAGNFSIFSRAAQDALLTAYERKTPALIFSSRKAYATIARCTHCDASVACPTCDIPMRWHRTTEDMLVCYHCSAFQKIPAQCATCHAGKLKPSGTPGSQKLAEAVHVILERAGYTAEPVPILDSDLIATHDDTKRVTAQLDAMTHPILVATSMIFSHRYSRSFETIIVPHLDMLASSPDYRSYDRLVLQIEKLADFSPERLVLTTYHNDGLTPFIQSRDWDSYFEAELAHRKSLRWPPFSRIIKLSYSHANQRTCAQEGAVCADRITRAIAHIGAKGTQLLGPSPALVEHSGGRFTQHIIIKSTLPSSRLSELLSYIPNGWTVDIDPRSIA